MRRKKNLEEKLLSYSNELLSLKSDDKNFSNADKYQDYIDTQSLFGNSNPVHLEIGCGKGQFAVEIAKRNPDINYLAVEKYANVLVDACEKLKESGITNLKFVRCSAEYLPTFIKPDSIGRIYLNFSCSVPACHRFFSYLHSYRRSYAYPFGVPLPSGRRDDRP
jgi:tRNA (guanine-N7-)-methyltransferase